MRERDNAKRDRENAWERQRECLREKETALYMQITKADRYTVYTEERKEKWQAEIETESMQYNTAAIL